MDFDYPWSILGIAPTSDDKAIRRAYAAKLKVTRPDEDAAGFQALVEARDFALHRSGLVEREAGGTDAEPPTVAIFPVREHLSPIEPVANVNELTGVELLDANRADIDALADSDTPTDGEQSDVSDLEALLAEVGKPHPWVSYANQWARAFDALEAGSFDDYPRMMWMVLGRLVHDLGQIANDIPDVSNWTIELGTYERGRLGVLGGVLQDFERRFGFLKNDTLLLDYMDEEDARDLINALTIAVGRVRAAQLPQMREINVEPINPDYVEAAWAGDEKMRSFYFTARAADKFPRSFSWLALLFPLPFALCYRLYGVAAFAGILAGANAALQILRRQGYVVPLGSMPVIVYLITAFALAFNWRRIRLQSLAARVRQLTDRGFGSVQIEDRLRKWGQPNMPAMWAGVAMLLIFSAARIYFR